MPGYRWDCYECPPGQQATGSEADPMEAYRAMLRHQQTAHNAWHDATPIDLFPGPPDPASVAPRTPPVAVASRETLQLPPRRGSNT